MSEFCNFFCWSLHKLIQFLKKFTGSLRQIILVLAFFHYQGLIFFHWMYKSKCCIQTYFWGKNVSWNEYIKPKVGIGIFTVFDTFNFWAISILNSEALCSFPFWWRQEYKSVVSKYGSVSRFFLINSNKMDRTTIFCRKKL